MQKVKVYLVTVHIAGWFLFMAFPLLFLNGGDDTSGLLPLKSPFYWLFCVTYILLFYANAHILIPRFFLKKRYLIYCIIIAALFAGICVLKPYDRLLRNNDHRHGFMPKQTQPGVPLTGEPGPTGLHSGRHFYPPPPGPQRHHPFIDSISIFIFLMIIALSAAARIIQEWQLTERRAARAEADKAGAELSFLKAQINPHFLFNTLNNIYTLAVVKDDDAPESIMKLSNIMRYVTDDAGEDFVPLQRELDCINDYIELQRLRLGGKTHIETRFSGEIENKKIAPLILMAFVENIFKYGISKREHSDILINAEATAGGIRFLCRNNIIAGIIQEEQDGIGLKNTIKRLEYIYPGRHTLDIRAENGKYTVNLNLQV